MRQLQIIFVVACSVACAQAVVAAPARTHAHKQFTFLGYTFRPRGARNRYGKLFDSFLPAVSLEATKKMVHTIKSWKLSRQTGGPSPITHAGHETDDFQREESSASF